jgi:CGNR zinc finger
MRRKRLQQQEDVERRYPGSASFFLEFELHTARKAVGSTPTAQIDWLEDFANRDLAAVNAVVTALSELNAFCLDHIDGWAPGLFLGPPGVGIEDDEFPPVLLEQVAEIQRCVRAGLNGLKDDEYWEFPTAITHGLVWSEGKILRITRGSGRDRFLAAVVDLFDQVEGKIRMCTAPACRRFFGFTRLNQTYCTRACGNRVAVQRYRENHPDLMSERRRTRHERELAERFKPTGQRLKATKRSRRETR